MHRPGSPHSKQRTPPALRLSRQNALGPLSNVPSDSHFGTGPSSGSHLAPAPHRHPGTPTMPLRRGKPSSRPYTLLPAPSFQVPASSFQLSAPHSPLPASRSSFPLPASCLPHHLIQPYIVCRNLRPHPPRFLRQRQRLFRIACYLNQPAILRHDEPLRHRVIQKPSRPS